MHDAKDYALAKTELLAVGALALPRESTVKASRIGKVWSGKTAEGKLWTMTKSDVDSFVTSHSV